MIAKKALISIIITIFLLSTFTVIVEATQVTWQSHDEGYVTAVNESKPVIIFFHTDWCTYCDDMDDETFPDDKVQNLADEFVWVLIDGDDQTWLRDNYDIEAYPTTIFTDQNGTEIGRTVGFRDAEDFSSDMFETLGYINGTIDKPTFSEAGGLCSFLLIPMILLGTVTPLLFGIVLVRRKSY